MIDRRRIALLGRAKAAVRAARAACAPMPGTRIAGDTLDLALATLDELSAAEAEAMSAVVDDEDTAPPRHTVGGTKLGGKAFYARVVG